jgi:hypothetical protein
MQSILQLLPKQVQMLLLQVMLLQMLWLLLRSLLAGPAHLLQQHTSGISNTNSIMGHNSSRRKHVSLLQPRLVKVNISFKAAACAAASGSVLWLALQCHMLTLCQLLQQTCAVASLR